MVEAEEKEVDLVPMYVMMANGDHVLSMGYWDDEDEMFCLVDPISVTRIYDPEDHKSNYVVRQWLAFSDDRVVHVDASQVVVAGTMSEKCFKIYDENRTSIYLVNGNPSTPSVLEDGEDDRVEKGGSDKNPLKRPMIEERAEDVVIPPNRVIH